MEYTIEEFEKEFESATDDMKSEILIKALDNLDITNLNIKNKLLDYRRELKDIHYQLKVDEDNVCNRLIDNGEYKLYECIKEVPSDNDILFWDKSRSVSIKLISSLAILSFLLAISLTRLAKSLLNTNLLSKIYSSYLSIIPTYF